MGPVPTPNLEDQGRLLDGSLVPSPSDMIGSGQLGLGIHRLTGRWHHGQVVVPPPPPHNTVHLFNCRRNPTNLTEMDLWTNPKEAAEFLQLDGDEEEA